LSPPTEGGRLGGGETPFRGKGGGAEIEGGTESVLGKACALNKRFLRRGREEGGEPR